MSRLNPVLLTNTAVSRMPFTDKGQTIVRDKDLPGFFVIVGKKTKTWSVQYDTNTLGKRKTYRRSLGRFPTLGAKEARKAAMVTLGQQEGARNSPTLREAHARYHRAALARQRADATIKQTNDCIHRLLKDWLDTELADLALNPADVAKEHTRITKEHGPYAANHAMAALRAVYNFERKRDKSLPEVNPVVDVIFNPTYRRNTGMSLRQLPGWYKRLSALPNPVRRELHLFMLLSGLRPNDAKRIEWRYLNVADRRLHIPHPKGGAAFDLPLSRGMLACLNRAKKAGAVMHPREAETYVFPSSVGHVAEYKEPALMQWGTSLRQSYATITKSLGVDDFYLGLLLNHRSTSVTLGYVTSPALFHDALEKQEQISRAILTATE